MNNRSINVERKSILALIFVAYKSFSLSFQRQRDVISSERELLFLAFTGTLILFMANLPVQIIKSSIVVGIEPRIYIGLIGFVSFFFIPLFLYIVSALLFFIFKFFKGSASLYDIRLALFWSLNVAGPLLILNGLLKGFFFNAEWIGYMNLILNSFIAWIISSMLTAAEKFKSTLPTFFIAVALIVIPQFMPLILS